MKQLAIGLTTVATLGTGVMSVAAHPIGLGGPGGPGLPIDDETRQAVEAALGNNDYAAFLAAVGEDKGEHITVERFAKMAEFHRARAAGDEEKLKELREAMKAEMEARRAEMEAKHEAVKTALENNDYQAFVDALGDHVPQDMSEEKFAQMAEVHALRAAGETEKARELAKEYGLKLPRHAKGMRLRHPRNEEPGAFGQRVRDMAHKKFRGRFPGGPMGFAPESTPAE